MLQPEMAHPFFHAAASAKKYGGVWEDYLDLHAWFDSSKAITPACVHRIALHTTFGLTLADQRWGSTLLRASDQVAVPVRSIGEDHITQDFGRIPTLAEAWTDAAPETRLKDERLASMPTILMNRHGGTAEDYAALIAWFEQPLLEWQDPRARRVVANAFGIFLAEQILGLLYQRPSGTRPVPTRVIAETYVAVLFGHIPTLEQAMHGIRTQAWMCRAAERLSKTFTEEAGYATL